MAENFPWLRYWCQRGGRPTLADDYLISPTYGADWYQPPQRATLKSLSQLADIPCLVLLGDPGSGKSNEIAAEVARLQAAGPAGLVLKRLDLKLRTESLIEKEVFQREEFLGWTQGRHGLVLFFDSMDECWRRVPELGPVILAELEPYLKKRHPPLFLRLGCRAAEWREELERDLRGVFGEKKPGEKVQVWELAPLTDADVQVAAQASGLNAGKFLEEVTELEVTAFAALPITLRMLLAIAKDGGPLGRDRAEIYQKGCALLCRDHHQSDKDKPRLATTIPQRLACASFLATLSVFSNRYLVFGSAERRPEDEDGVIAALDVLGRKPLLPGIDVEFTREALAETLQSGLFDAQSGELYSWRHQSYAEYLAASYLQRRQLPAAEIIQCLCDTSRGRPRIWPQLEETSCWVATLVPDVFQRLVETNADVFVRCDPARLSPDLRAQIATGYLNQVRGHEAVAANGREVRRLRRLAHPDLAQQLSGILIDPQQDDIVRDLAVDIARACEARELTDLLIQIMCSTAETQRLRHSAGVTLRDWSDANIRAKVRAHLHPERLDDDVVRGCVLGILWPGTLTEQELVTYLKEPSKDNYVGSYQVFLSDLFPAGLAKADLVPLLQWVRTVGHHSESDHPFDGASQAVLLAAFRSIDQPDVRAEFLLVLKDQQRRYGRLFKPDGRDFAKELPCRKVLWRELVATDWPMRQTIVRASLPESGLTQPNDFDWVMDEAVAAQPREAARWLEVAFWLFQPENRPEQIERILPFAAADQQVADRLLLYTSCSLVESNGEPNWKKDAHYRDEKRNAERAQRKPFRQRIDELLAKYEADQKPNAIWELMHRFTHPVKDPDEPGGNNYSDVGWKHLSDEQRARWLALAPVFIPTVSVDHAELYDPKKYYWNYVAGLTFLLELVETEAAWPASQPAEFWAAWTPVVIRYEDKPPSFEDEAWQRLLALAFERARPAFLSTLQRWLAERGNLHVPLKRFSRLPAALDPDVERILLDHVLSAQRDFGSEFDFLAFLLSQGSPRTQATLESWQPVAGATRHEKAALADALLFNFRAPTHGRAVIDRIMGDAAWGKDVFHRLASIGGVYSTWVERTDAETLCRIWEWLDREFPGDPFDDDGDGSVTPPREIALFRNHLLGYIEKLGTEPAVEALRGLVLRHPEYPWLGRVLAQARHILRREAWDAPAVAALADYLGHTGTPPLCSDADLADAIIASLARYQALLKGPTPLTELWNEPAGPVKVWIPKDEENLSDCLARHLERDLRPHHVNVTRESELRQGTAATPGDEPDLLVTAPNASGNKAKLSVVIENKCSWNRETLTGIEQQLLNRYLRGMHCGIYVVAHFNCPSWSKDDTRKTQALSAKSMADVEAGLQMERQRVAAITGKRIDVVVIDAAT